MNGSKLDEKSFDAINEDILEGDLSFILTPEERKIGIDDFNNIDDYYLCKLLEFCSEHIKNRSYVYKLISHENLKSKEKKDWLIIMKKTDDTITNERRNGIIDKNFAKFRANELVVVEIINILNPNERIDKILNRFQDCKEVQYVKGKIVRPDYYNEDIEHVCSAGIHYFKTLFAAYYYRKVPKNYTGKWFGWGNNGEIVLNGEYENGRFTGKLTSWHLNGRKKREENYVNSLLSGQFIEWYDNGQIKTDCTYNNGKISDKGSEWSSDGMLIEEKNYCLCM